MSTIVTERPAPTMSSPEILRRVNALRRTDNWRNWFYMVREYLGVRHQANPVVPRPDPLHAHAGPLRLDRRRRRAV